MSRTEDLEKIFSGCDPDVYNVIHPMIINLAYVEDQLDMLKTKPMIEFHPTNPMLQRTTPSAKLFKELLSQQKDIVRVLCGILGKSASSEEDSPLRAYMKSVGLK